MEAELNEVGRDTYETGTIQGSEDLYRGRYQTSTHASEAQNDEEGKGVANDVQHDKSNVTGSHISNTEATSLSPISHSIQIDISRAFGFSPSYNVAPTNTSVIIYMTNEKAENITTKYIFEKLKFGMIPDWAKPDSQGTPNIKQIQQLQSKFFNCRRETLAREKSVWTQSRKKQRCVVPIQGYFEWLKTGSNKVTHFVYSKSAPIYYLAGLYSHNVNFSDLNNVRNEYLSSFTIVTGPALKSAAGDMSWLHSRKPMRILPGTKAWNQWLDPNYEWKDELLEDVLGCEVHDAYLDIEGYPVSKDVGNLKSHGEYLIKREKVEQKSIALFFGERKGKKKAGKETPIKNDEKEDIKKDDEKEDTKKAPIKKEQKEEFKEDIKGNINEDVTKDLDSVLVENSIQIAPEPSTRSEISDSSPAKRQKPNPIPYRSSKKELPKKKKQEGIALFFKPVKEH